MGPRKLKKKRRENNNALLGLENGYIGPIWRRRRLESWPTFFLYRFECVTGESAASESSPAYCPTLQTESGTTTHQWKLKMTPATRTSSSCVSLFSLRISLWLLPSFRMVIINLFHPPKLLIVPMPRGKLKAVLVSSAL